MLLRTRISLLVILAFAVICIGLTFASILREDLIKAQYSGATITDRSTLWRKINASLVQRMEDKAWIAAEDEALRRALYTGDQEAVQRTAARVTAQLRDEGIADRFDLLYADGALAYSSNSALFQSPVIAAGLAREAIQNGTRVRGIGNDQQRNVAVVLGIPLGAPPGSVGIAGMGVYATSIDEAILEMEQATKSSVLIVNRRGRPLAGTAAGLWENIGKLIDLTAVDTLQTVEADERVFSAVVLPQTAELGSLVARLISIKDVTELARQQQQVSQITVLSVIAFLGLVLIGLGYYMSRSFVPLTDGVGVLNALSRGDLQARVEGAGGRDEVGRIAGAVNVFRANLIAFDRFRRSRERQRRRQERFIRREMTQLADTLDEEERVAVLAEMDQLEHLVRGTPDGEDRVISIADATDSASTALTRESDSLAMTALAFQKMSDRVQDQNQSLREALAAKNAFIALQKELDIAGRVQLSLLPDTMPLSERAEMTGVMRPAKEVGGDFYDFFYLDQHRIALTVADVSGKGVPAGLFMVMTRTLLRATAVRYADAPGPGTGERQRFPRAEQLRAVVRHRVLRSAGRAHRSLRLRQRRPQSADTRRQRRRHSAGDDRRCSARNVRRARLRRRPRGHGARCTAGPVLRRGDRSVQRRRRGIRRRSAARHHPRTSWGAGTRPGRDRHRHRRRRVHRRGPPVRRHHLRGPGLQGRSGCVRSLGHGGLNSKVRDDRPCPHRHCA